MRFRINLVFLYQTFLLIGFLLISSEVSSQRISSIHKSLLEILSNRRSHEAEKGIKQSNALVIDGPIPLNINQNSADGQRSERFIEWPTFSRGLKVSEILEFKTSIKK